MFFALFVLGFIAFSALLVRAVAFVPKPIARTRHRAVVVVGGDFARSPRMQYHAVSLADSGLFDEVVCIGMDFGNKCCEDVQKRLPKSNLLEGGQGSTRSGTIVLKLMPASIRQQGGNWLLNTLRRVLGFVWNFSGLLWQAVEWQVPSDVDVPVIFVQTPPAVPFLQLIKLVLWVQKAARGFVSPANATRVTTKMVTDWHNFGYTLLEVDHRPKPAVWLYKFFERYLCRGDYNLTVSLAMKRVLTGRPEYQSIGFRLPLDNVIVLHDTAPSFFAPCSKEEFLLEVISKKAEDLVVPDWFVSPRAVKGVVMVSSTSWTADDDYSMLVEALQLLTQTGTVSPHTPLWLVVTGKGETRSVFERQIREANLPPFVTVSTVYFQSFRNYARMLGVADLGISLHRSSSGWDLPMKVVDMFGCGIPVLGLDYPALKDLISSEYGWRFSTATELCEYLQLPFKKPEEVETKTSAVRRYRSAKWDETWRAAVMPLLKGLLSSAAKDSRRK